MPSDVADAVSQDAIAESLMSEPEVNAGESVAEEQPEVQGEEQYEEETQQEETDYLPSEQEKVFPDDVLLKYAQRYKLDEEWLSNPLNRQLLHDKINSDIYAQQQNQAKSEIEEDPEPVKQEPTPQQLSTQDWLKHVDQVAQKYVHPDVANAFTANFLKAFGVKEAPSPETSQALSHVFTAGVINVLNTVLPDLMGTQMPGGKNFFQSLVEGNYEGFGDHYETSMYDSAWQKATSSNPAYKDLPALNAPGSSQARMAAAEKIAGSVEDFDALRFTGKDGKPLSSYQNAVKKYGLLAKTMAGQKLTPAEAKTFVEAGARVARKQQIQRESGNLGSGKSNGKITQGSHANDDIFGEGLAIYQKEHGRI